MKCPCGGLTSHINIGRFIGEECQSCKNLYLREKDLHKIGNTCEICHSELKKVNIEMGVAYACPKCKKSFLPMGMLKTED